jgi:hypothetical protein
MRMRMRKDEDEDIGFQRVAYRSSSGKDIEVNFTDYLSRLQMLHVNRYKLRNT